MLLSVEGGIIFMSLSFSTSESGLCVVGSIPLCLSFFFRHEFHRFLISLSVLPGVISGLLLILMYFERYLLHGRVFCCSRDVKCIFLTIIPLSVVSIYFFVTLQVLFY